MSMKVTRSRPRIRLAEMKNFSAQWLWPLLLGALLLGVSGCSTTEPENASVRPWNTPQGWESGMPMMNQQHP